MNPRWRLLITLWLSLTLPLQGLAASAGVWCVQQGFHGGYGHLATALPHGVAAPAAGGHGSHRAGPDGHGAHGHGAHLKAMAQATGFDTGIAGDPLRPASDAHVTRVMPLGFAEASSAQTPAANAAAVEDVDTATLSTVTAAGAVSSTCSLCASCGMAQIMPTALRLPADAAAEGPRGIGCQGHPSTQLSGLERPPRIALV
jgi:hypothetical protein